MERATVQHQRHIRDHRNIQVGPHAAIASFGVHSGGMFHVDSFQPVQIMHKLTLCDPTLPHFSEPFNGLRFTVVAFSRIPLGDQKQTELDLIRLGFRIKNTESIVPALVQVKTRYFSAFAMDAMPLFHSLYWN